MPFSNQTRYIISLLSSGRCANPVCRKQLLENNRLIGEFCHLEGEKEGSARYNPNSTEKQRNEHQNAIMLCANCHTLVDKDETTYTVYILNSWKKSDEESPKLEDWLEKGVLSVRVLAKVEKNLPIRPTILPGERSLFVGRRAEIAELSQLISNGIKTLSLVGEGGIGKTSVSIKLVRHIENSYDITIPINLKKDMNYQDFLLEVSKFTDLPFVNNLQPDELENLIREIFGKIGRILLWVDNYENLAALAIY
jgi:ATP-dependent Clp protease ATP-binding subunit ClpA